MGAEVGTLGEGQAIGLKVDGPGMGADAVVKGPCVESLVDVAVHRTVSGGLKLKVAVAGVSLGAVLVREAKQDMVSCVVPNTVSVVAIVTMDVV